MLTTFNVILYLNSYIISQCLVQETQGYKSNSIFTCSQEDIQRHNPPEA